MRTALAVSLALSAASMLAACAPSPARAPVPPAGPDQPAASPAVDLDRLRAAIRGAWSTTQHNDMSSITWTLDFGADTVARRQTWTQLDGTSRTTPQGSAPYRLTPTGAVAFTGNHGERLQFTAIVADTAACSTLVGHPCRTLGWGGFLAQSADRTIYRREYDRAHRNAKGEQRSRVVSTLRFARSPASLASAASCRLELAVTASSVVDGRPQRTASHRFSFDCDVTPAAKGPFTRLAVRGFSTDPSSVSTEWSNYLGLRHLLDDHAGETHDAFRHAFEPVLYFDPADPWILYFERPLIYWGDP